MQTNCRPRLLLHRQKSLGKSRSAKVALAKVASAKVAPAKVASCSAKVSWQKLQVARQKSLGKS